MSSFFEKARNRAQEAAAQFQQSVSSSGNNQEGGGSSQGGGGGSAGARGSFTYTGSLPHVFRHGVASLDPRYEYNRSFHQLSGRIKSTRIDHEAIARETKGMATATYQWGQSQLAEKREDGAGDEALADVSDRLAYVLSLIGDLHVEHAKRVEDSRADLKRIQKLESELAPRRQLRIKIHRELCQLLPERAMAHSEKVAPLEEHLKVLEQEDQEKEQELGKLKREALRSSYDAHFDSLIELGEKMAVAARYGKLLCEELPVYAPPFPTLRSHHRTADEPVWQNEARVAAIRAAVGPALEAHKVDTSLPTVAMPGAGVSLSRRETMSFAESNQQELAESLRDTQDEKTTPLPGSDPPDQSSLSPLPPPRHSISSNSGQMSPLPEGGSLPPNLNLEPTVLPPRRGTLTDQNATAHGAATLPPYSPFDEEGRSPSGTVDDKQQDGSSAHNATIADGGPTFAETGSPVVSNDPGPKSGVLSPRRSAPDVLKPMPSLPIEMQRPSAAVPEQQEPDEADIHPDHAGTSTKKE